MGLTILFETVNERNEKVWNGHIIPNHHKIERLGVIQMDCFYYGTINSLNIDRFHITVGELLLKYL